MLTDVLPNLSVEEAEVGISSSSAIGIDVTSVLLET
jgi:hypothetical protein